MTTIGDTNASVSSVEGTLFLCGLRQRKRHQKGKFSVFVADSYVAVHGTHKISRNIKTESAVVARRLVGKSGAENFCVRRQTFAVVGYRNEAGVLSFKGGYRYVLLN